MIFNKIFITHILYNILALVALLGMFESGSKDILNSLIAVFYIAILFWISYTQSKKNIKITTLLMVGFVNLFLFLLSFLFDKMGSNFNILSTNNSNTFFFTLAFWAYNSWSFYFLDDSNIGINFTMVCITFLVPYIAYIFAQRKKNQSIEQEST